MRILLVLLTILLILATGRVTADPASYTTATGTEATSTADALRLDSLSASQTIHVHKRLNDVSSSDSDDAFALLIPLLFITGASFIVWRSIESRRDVRMAMIDKGMNPSLSQEPTDESSRKFSALRFGMLLTGVGFGLLIAIVIVNIWPTVQFVEGIFVGSSLLYGGVGLMAYHIIARRLEK